MLDRLPPILRRGPAFWRRSVQARVVVSTVLLSVAVVGIVGAHVDDADSRPLERITDPLNAFLGVPRVALAHEQHDRSPVGDGFTNELPGLAPGREIVRSDVDGARRLGRVAVLREDERASRRRVDHRCLVLRIDG